MNIVINVSGNSSSLTQTDWQRIRRCASMLTEAGFTVKINWDTLENNEKHE